MEHSASYETGYYGLFDAILSLKTKAECENFFHDMCTQTELAAFHDRWRAASLIEEGMSYRYISEQTGISTTTIGRAARYINGGSQVTKQILEKQGGKINK